MKFHRNPMTLNQKSPGRIDSTIGSPNLKPRSDQSQSQRYVSLPLTIEQLSVKFERNSFIRSLTMSCRSIPIMDVRIRTPDRRITNLILKLSLTDRQLSLCEISLKSDRPFSQNKCVTSRHTDTQTHRQPTHVKV